MLQILSNIPCIQWRILKILKRLWLLLAELLCKIFEKSGSSFHLYVNAKSLHWGAKAVDARGMRVDAKIAELNWQVLNDPAQGPTFDSPMGQSFIDVTLANRGGAMAISNWKILRYSTISSHNMISFSLTSRREATQHQPSSGRYNLNRANWEKFQLSLTRCLEPTNSPITGDREVEKLARSVTRAIHRAATASIPRKTRTRARGVVWWTPLLSDLKRMVYAAKKSYQHARCSNTENIESSLSDYCQI